MKKKIIFSIILLISIVCYFFVSSNKNTHTRTYSSYCPEKAISYSYEYAFKRNSDFPNFDRNCVCFVSQCLLAGGLEMDGRNNISTLSRNKIVNTKNQWYCYSFEADPYKPIYYYLSSSFSSSRYFIPYWTDVAGVPFTIIENTESNREKLRKDIKPGDVLILYGQDSIHAALVVKIDETDIYYNSNTSDRLEYPLSFVDVDDYPKIGYLNFVVTSALY